MSLDRCCAQVCVDVCCIAACTVVCRELPPCVTVPLGLVFSITLLAIGIIGACRGIHMQPAVAYYGFITPAILLGIISCMACCKRDYTGI